MLKEAQTELNTFDVSLKNILVTYSADLRYEGNFTKLKSNFFENITTGDLEELAANSRLNTRNCIPSLCRGCPSRFVISGLLPK